MTKINYCAVSPPYINREHSWLQFNARVLSQAEAKENPLLERCGFLSIFTSNLDEFTRVRIGSISNLITADPEYRDNKTGMDAKSEMQMILSELPQLYQRTEKIFTSLRKELKKEGLDILMHFSISDAQKKRAYEIFNENVIPFISPLVLDAKHPLIKFEDRRVYLVLLLERDGREMFGVASLDRKMPPIMEIKSGKSVKIMPTEEMLFLFGDTLFPGMEVKEKALVRASRNADFEAELKDADIEYDYDFSKLIKTRVEGRGSSAVIRLEMNSSSEKLKNFLFKQMGVKKSQCFYVGGCFSYKFLFSLDRYFTPEKLNYLRYPAFKPALPFDLRKGGMIDSVLERDIMLLYPYQAMDPVLWLLDEASEDRRVMNIKITIYRLADHSKVVSTLIKAAENGKEVSVVMELSARFDEESNLNYAKELKDAGCNVFYGIENYKVHSKIISIALRDDENAVRYITHLGTGNYNESTAKQYTDVNILTSNKEIGQDGVDFFRNLATLNLDAQYRKLLVAPYTLKKRLLEEIDREIEKGQKGEIIFKLNGLSDNQMIDKLIEASGAGVKVNLIVRGICCIVPSFSGYTENIKIKSIVGRFLEHSRIYSFGSGSMYISSADLMTRNVNRRVEIATPVLNNEFKKEISAMLSLMLKDNVKGMCLSNDGRYYSEEKSGGEINSQEMLLRIYREKK